MSRRYDVMMFHVDFSWGLGLQSLLALKDFSLSGPAEPGSGYSLLCRSFGTSVTSDALKYHIESTAHCAHQPDFAHEGISSITLPEGLPQTRVHTGRRGDRPLHCPSGTTTNPTTIRLLPNSTFIGPTYITTCHSLSTYLSYSTAILCQKVEYTTTRRNYYITLYESKRSIPP